MKGDIFVGQVVPMAYPIYDQNDEPIDLSTATNIQVIALTPRYERKVFGALAVNVSGVYEIRYTTTPADLDQDGGYRIRCQYDKNGVVGIPTDETLMTVKSRF